MESRLTLHARCARILNRWIDDGDNAPLAHLHEPSRAAMRVVVERSVNLLVAMREVGGGCVHCIPRPACVPCAVLLKEKILAAMPWLMAKEVS